MNTKNCLLLIIVLAISWPSQSVNNRFYSLGNQATISQVPVEPASMPVDWRHHVPLMADTTLPHPQEDGKHHYFHFERLARMKRGRKLCCAFCRLIIIIMHASLLYVLLGLAH